MQQTVRPAGRPGRPVVLAAALLACALRAQGAGEVLRSEPREYTDVLAPLMTPLHAALESEPKALEEHAAGITLLDERLDAVGDDGRAMRVRNIVRKTLTDAGAHWNADETFVYRRKEQQFYVLQAETIQSDGTVQSVKADAILVNSPQRQAEFALYDDLIEVRVIFPNVKAGCITHIVVITEDLKARMPGEFAEAIEWSGTWPRGRIHFVTDVSGKLAKRMRVQTVGTEVPPMRREELPGGHVRYSFEKTGIAPLADENGSAPAEQVGPCIHFTTIQDWADVGRWFTGLLKDRDLLTPALAAKVDDWTRGTSDPDAVLGILYGKVANDVRYAGLELGESDYQPHECNAVWDVQYGDCKDKANLLVAFLRHKGFPAYMTFLNATDAGLIDRRTPDFHVFSHAIVALPDGRGGYRFCDPTIARGRPGLLSPADEDRDVLVVSDTSSEWVHTPSKGAGQFAFHFDLELKPTGELAGWLEITADGFYGATEDETFHRLDRDESRQTAGQIARNFYPGTEVIDVANKPRQDPADRFLLRAYVTIPRRLEHGSGQQALTFPRTKDFFDYLGFTPNRKTPFFIYRGRISVSASVKLPPGMAPGDVPAAYDVDTPAGPIHAQWQVSQDACRCELTFENTQSVLSPDEFKGYYEGVQTLEAWLDRPVSFTFSGAPSTVASSETVLRDFPQMPSGAGQLALANSRYPEGGNLALRRAALEKTIQYFPDDKATVFQASVYLASADWRAGNTKEAIAHLEVLLAAYRSGVSPEIYGWGRWVYALVLHGAGQDGAATEVSTSVASDASLSGGLRARSALTAADILKKTGPDKALAALDGAIHLTSEVQPDLYALMSYVLLGQGRPADVKRQLNELIQAQPGALDNFFSRIVRDTRGWTAPGDDALQKELFELIGEVLPKAGEGLRSTMAAALADRGAEQLYSGLQARLAEAFSSKDLAAWAQSAIGDPAKSDEDFDLAIKTASAGGDVTRCVHLSVQALLGLHAGPAFPLRWNRAVAFADWRERTIGGTGEDPVLTTLLSVCDDVPRAQNAYWSGQLILDGRMDRKGDTAKVQARVSRLLADPSMPDRYRPPALVLLAKSEEKAGAYDKALATYGSLEPYAPMAPENAGALLRAVFLNLHLGRPAEAIRVIQALEAIDSAVINKSDGAAQIREFIALRRSGSIPDFWARALNWWPQWEALASPLQLPPEAGETAVPVIASTNEWSAQIGSAFRANDSAAFFRELRRGASAARWLPGASIDFGSFIGMIPQMSPGMTGDFRRLIIRILEREQDDLGDEAGRRLRLVSLSAFYVDEANPAGAMNTVREYWEIPKVDDATNRRMDIVWGAAALALRDGMADCIAALQHDLEVPLANGNVGNVAVFRAREAAILSALLGSTGQSSEMNALLGREAQDPRIAGDPTARQLLETAQLGLVATTPGKQFNAMTYGNRQGSAPFDSSAPFGANLSNPSASKEVPDASPQSSPRKRDAEFRTIQLAILDKAVAENRADATTYYLRGSLRSDTADLDGAIADLTKSIAMDPTNARARTMRGLAETRKGFIGDAIADFNTSIRLDPNSSLPFFERGAARMRVFQFDLAIADFNRAIRLDPVNARAYRSRGDCKARNGDMQGANEDFAVAKRYGISNDADAGFESGSASR